MSGTRSCGTANWTSIGFIWVITAMPVLALAATLLPGSTVRSPMRPATGAVIRV